MSRIGKQPVEITDGAQVSVDNGIVTVKGAKGELSMSLPSGITVDVDGTTVTVARANDEKVMKSQHGLIRSEIQNMITGTTKGFEKKLEVNGVGFKVKVSGQEVTLSLGFSHDVHYTVPAGVLAQAEGTNITITGFNKQQVGQVAAEIREFKKPEPYKGKGIKYSDEFIIRKAGKTAGGD